jgi:hypothetical protein
MAIKIQDRPQFQKFAAPEIWAALRVELSEDIAIAHKILVEHAGYSELRSKLGLNIMDKRRRLEQIMGSWRPSTFEDFLTAYREIESLQHTPEQIELFRQFTISISLRFTTACRAVLAKAVTSIEKTSAEALAAEKEFFAEAGLNHQGTAITAGVNSVRDRIKNLAGFFATAAAGIVEPGESHLGELFADVSANWKAEEAAIEKSGKFPITLSNKLRFKDEKYE